jgi:hypothetical protein
MVDTTKDGDRYDKTGVVDKSNSGNAAEPAYDLTLNSPSSILTIFPVFLASAISWVTTIKLV